MSSPYDHIPAMALEKSVPVIFTALLEDERPSGPWEGDCGIVTHVEPGRVMISLDGAPDAGSIEAGTAEGWRVDLEDPQGAAYIRRRLAEVHGLDPRGGIVFTKQAEYGHKKGTWLIEDMNGTSTWVLKDCPIPADQITLALAHAAKRWLSNPTKETP